MLITPLDNPQSVAAVVLSRTASSVFFLRKVKAVKAPNSNFLQMATDIDTQREKDQRLNEVLKQHQMEFRSKYSTVQKAAIKGEGDDTLGNSVVDQSFLVPLITEYDKHLEELNGQLEYYQKQVGEMKLQLENVIKENERLHSELKDGVEKQLEALPFGTEMGSDIYADDETVRNLREQLQLANQEKNQVLELWQTVSQELDRLQKLYQEHMTEAQIHVVESQKQKDQLISFQQLTQQLHVTNENTEMSPGLLGETGKTVR